MNNEINSAAYCLQPHRRISLLLPLTISLIIKAFSQEVMNVMLKIAIRKVSFSFSTCWMSTQNKRLGFNRLALPAASSPGGMGPSGELRETNPFSWVPPDFDSMWVLRGSVFAVNPGTEPQVHAVHQLSGAGNCPDFRPRSFFQMAMQTASSWQIILS